MRAVLALEDGSFFVGRAVGAEGLCTGELIFNTAIAGYERVLTDPSYHKQIVVMTYPHVGNYGMVESAYESDQLHVAGFVVRSLNKVPSSSQKNTRALSDALRKSNIVAIDGLDTRLLTRFIRDRGTMLAAIATQDNVPWEETLKKALHAAKHSPPMIGACLAPDVSTKEVRVFSSPEPRAHIVAYDFGIKKAIEMNLLKRGCKITRVPYSTPASFVINELCPDGVVLSNGPGDPAALPEVTKEIQSLIGKIPIFGICLGHQILGLAVGGKSIKLSFGHHGINHPVQNLLTSKVEITSHNHGFAIEESSCRGKVKVTYRSLYDGTLEGMEGEGWFSVQFHPEAAPGPRDAEHLFDRFLEMVDN